MPQTRVTKEALVDSAIGLKGKYPVIELREDHEQLDLEVIPKGTRGIVISSRAGKLVCVFPHTEESDKYQAFSDGTVRVVPKHYAPVVGRVDIR